VEHSDAWSRPSTLGSEAVQQHYVTSVASAAEAVDQELRQSDRQGVVISGVAGDSGAGVLARGYWRTLIFLLWLISRRSYKPFTSTVCGAGFWYAAAAACRR
jgi:hypothetical protein